MRSKSKNIVMCALFTVLIAAGAFIKIPSPLPFTMQLFFVVMSGLLLGSKRGAVSCAVYMALGLIGLPIFTQGGGIYYILKPSFGYIIGFILSAFLTGLIAERRKNPSVVRMLIASFVGMLVAYGVGMAYYYLIYGLVLDTWLGVAELFAVCVFVTAPADIVLSVFAVFLSKRIRGYMLFY